MEGIEIYGGPFKAPFCDVTTSGDAVLLRIGTTTDAKVWARVHITHAALLKLLAMAAPPELPDVSDLDLPPVPMPDLPKLSPPADK